MKKKLRFLCEENQQIYQNFLTDALVRRRVQRSAIHGSALPAIVTSHVLKFKREAGIILLYLIKSSLWFINKDNFYSKLILACDIIIYQSFHALQSARYFTGDIFNSSNSKLIIYS